MCHCDQSAQYHAYYLHQCAHDSISVCQTPVPAVHDRDDRRAIGKKSPFRFGARTRVGREGKGGETLCRESDGRRRYDACLSSYPGFYLSRASTGSLCFSLFVEFSTKPPDALPNFDCQSVCLFGQVSMSCRIRSASYFLRVGHSGHGSSTTAAAADASNAANHGALALSPIERTFQTHARRVLLEYETHLRVRQ